jgi:hypothetical protein
MKINRRIVPVLKMILVLESEVLVVYIKSYKVLNLRVALKPLTCCDNN